MIIPQYEFPEDTVYVGALPHKGKEGTPIEEFCFSLYLEGSLLFSRKELAIADRAESCRSAGQTFHEILKSKSVDPRSMDIFNRGRTSSDELDIIDCDGLKERDLMIFLESLEQPFNGSYRRESVDKKSYGNCLEVCLGVMPHHVGERLHIPEKCYSLYADGRLAHAVKEIDLVQAETAGAIYAGRRFRRMLEERGTDLGKVIITNGGRTTSEGLRRVRCEEFSEEEVLDFRKAFYPSAAA